jgi:transposase
MGAAVKITRSDEDAAALRRLAAKSADAEQSRRLLAIAMVKEGTDRAAAARLTGMDRQTLRDWVHRYNAAGPAGLTSRKAPGPAAKLTPEQMQALRKLTLDGPDPERHDVVRWRCCDLREEIAARFEVKVCERTVGKWLRKLDLTRLQPRPHHPKKDAEAQETFKKTFPLSCKMLSLTKAVSDRSKSGFKTRPE